MSKRTASPGYPTPVLARFRRCTAAALLLVLLALAVACGSDPTPTPTPTATATPAPTATPTPLPATPTPLPPTPTPTPAPLTQADPGEFIFTETTTTRDIMALLSDDEVACVRNAFGASAFDAAQDIPLASLPTSVDFPIHCLAPENAIGISIAMMSAAAGGLSAETRSCIAALAQENPSVLGIGEPPEDPAELFSTAIQMQLCMSDEEAARLAGGSGEQIPPPSVMRCMEEQLGSLEDLLALFFGGEPDLAALGELMAAAETCGLEMTPPAGGSGFGQ